MEARKVISWNVRAMVEDDTRNGRALASLRQHRMVKKTHDLRQSFAEYEVKSRRRVRRTNERELLVSAKSEQDQFR